MTCHYKPYQDQTLPIRDKKLQLNMSLSILNYIVSNITCFYDKIVKSLGSKSTYNKRKC